MGLVDLDDGEVVSGVEGDIGGRGNTQVRADGDVRGSSQSVGAGQDEGW